MEARTDQLMHLERLAEVLRQQGFAAELTATVSRPYLLVANTGTPTLNERVFAEPTGDGSWVYWWPWQQPIGSVDDLPSIVGKIAEVLRSVEGA